MKKEKENKIQSIWSVAVGQGVKILITKGKMVDFGDILAVKNKKKIKKIFFPHWLKSDLGAWSQEGKKKAGNSIDLAEILFEKKTFFKGSRRWLAPIKGELAAVNEKEGYLEILIGQEEEKLISPVAGKVTKASAGEIAISFKALEFLGEGFGEKTGWGKLIVIKNYPLSAISRLHQGQVLLVKEITGPLLKKGMVLGVAAVVGFLGQREVVERSPLPVLILRTKKGKKRAKESLRSFSGQHCFVNPAQGQLLICQKKNGEEKN